MRISAIQFRPERGDVARNIESHLEYIDRAVLAGAEVVFFPELSITGYEPDLAARLAFDTGDARLDVFQSASEKYEITIAVGLPIRLVDGISISMLFFRPNQPRQVYSKQYLHSDEFPFFRASTGTIEMLDGAIAPAICYESSVPEHASHANHLGAKTYLVSVANTQQGMEKSMLRLADISKTYSMNVILANCLGPNDNFLGFGRSCAFDRHGNLLAELDSEREGYVMLDTLTEEVLSKQW